MLADVHTHILPCLDDGAPDVETSRTMLDLLETDGVTDVVLTPHFYFHNQNMTTFLEKRQASFEALRSVYCGPITLHLGAEVEFSNLSIDYSLFRNLGLDGGRYILLELPYRGALEKTILPKLEQFTYHTGLFPIIAHVDRYEGIAQQPWVAAELIDLGCLLQVNGDAILQSRPGSLVDALFRKEQVHLLGTDCHNTTTRKPEYGRVLEAIRERYGPGCTEALAQNAQRVLSGKPLPVAAHGRIRKFFGTYR